MPFSKNQLTDHSSDLNDTVEDGLNYYVVFFDRYVITLSFNRSYPNCCLHFVNEKMADFLHVKNRASMLKAVLQ